MDLGTFQFSLDHPLSGTKCCHTDTLVKFLQQSMMELETSPIPMIDVDLGLQDPSLQELSKRTARIRRCTLR